PNVKGWAGGRMWINTSTLFVRYNTASAMVGGGTLAALTGRKPPRARSLKDPSINVDDNGSPEAIADQWVNRLIQRPIEPDKKKVLIEALGENPKDESVKKMIQLIVSMPEYQLC